METLLVDALDHMDARIRLRAIDGLRYLLGESKPAIAALAKVATEGGADGIRACRTLADLGPGARSALPTLRALLDSSDPLPAHAAAQALDAIVRPDRSRKFHLEAEQAVFRIRSADR